MKMTHSEIIAKLVGPVSPTGDHGEDQKRLANLRTMSGVLLDLLGDIVEAAKSADRQEASVQAIGKYAKNTIGIVNENTGAWDENARLQAVVDKLRALPTKVCLCGSTRFMEAFFAAGWELTLMGQIVLSVGVCKHADADGGHGGEALGPKVAARLDDLHKRKIDLADWVLVLNIDGYIGDSTRSEMEYAKAIGKSTIVLFSDALMPPRETPPDPDDHQSWDTVAAATREAAEAAKDQANATA